MPADPPDFTDLVPTEAPAPRRQAMTFSAPVESPFDAPPLPFHHTPQPAQRMARYVPQDVYGQPVGRRETDTPAEPEGPTGVRELNPMPPRTGFVNPGVVVAVGVTLLVSALVALMELYEAGRIQL
ncbi:MAG: hypothetical protein KTR31_30200 [Myxococcales bacterium]|nr:hypothetical protein [Myxococcales bacterium]